MDEYILFAVVRLDKTIAFDAAEPLDGTVCTIVGHWVKFLLTPQTGSIGGHSLWQHQTWVYPVARSILWKLPCSGDLSDLTGGPCLNVRSEIYHTMGEMSNKN